MQWYHLPLFPSLNQFFASKEEPKRLYVNTAKPVPQVAIAVK